MTALSQIFKPLTSENIREIHNNIKLCAMGRVAKLYLFGSSVRNDFRPDSDIDIVIIKETAEKFVRRSFEFEDLFAVHPRLDILVYTPAEFEKLHNSDTPFWKKFRKDYVELI